MSTEQDVASFTRLFATLSGSACGVDALVRRVEECAVVGDPLDHVRVAAAMAEELSQASNKSSWQPRRPGAPGGSVLVRDRAGSPARACQGRWGDRFPHARVVGCLPGCVARSSSRASPEVRKPDPARRRPRPPRKPCACSAAARRPQRVPPIQRHACQRDRLALSPATVCRDLCPRPYRTALADEGSSVGGGRDLRRGGPVPMPIAAVTSRGA